MGCNKSKDSKHSEHIELPISHKELIKQIGNNKSIIDELVEQGLEDIEKNITEIKNIFEKNVPIFDNKESLRFQSHSIKGTSANICCIPLSNMGEKFKTIVDDNDIKFKEKDIREMKHILNNMNIEIVKIKGRHNNWIGPM